MGEMEKKMKNMDVKKLYYFPKGMAHKIYYKQKMGEELDLKNPRDFNQKLHYLMVNEIGKKEARLADKYLVRDFVKEKGYEQTLPKLYGVYQKAEEIDLEKLPEKFVLKTNHDSGSIFICTDKNTFDFASAKQKLNQSLRRNFARRHLEYHYKYIKPRIICEEFIEGENGNAPADYKIFCFDGKPECILVCENRQEDLKLSYYDLNWNKLDYVKKQYASDNIIPKPENLDVMLKMAENLSQGFKHVRVDLYNVKGKIYFSELTFTSAAGLGKKQTKEALEYLGSLIKV